MAQKDKTKTVYVCTECGYVSPKWSGKCMGCGAWNTLTEEVQRAEPSVKKPISTLTSATPISLMTLDPALEKRTSTGIGELDRVLGGGLVLGSLVLLSGEPGIGKSTVLLQTCKTLPKDKVIYYVAGEESPAQLKMRAERIGVDNPNLFIITETDIEEICAIIEKGKPDLVIIDSIQTVSHPAVTSSPGSVTQVKECTASLMRTCKTTSVPVFIVGHVNKEGSIAGPKVMEHMVDTVLYFEGERNLDCRILRAVKNRFGSTNEIGVFEMTGEGLLEIENPSRLFLDGKPENISGIATVCTLEGTRPIIAEIQSLVSQTPFPAPRRTSTGFDYNRLNLLIAVLEKRCGLYFGNSDVYLNVIGGLRISEPAADLAIATAMASALKDFIIPDDTILIGELGLAGEVRNVAHLDKRIEEAESFGFKRCLYPARNKLPRKRYGIELIGVSSIREAFSKL